MVHVSSPNKRKIINDPVHGFVTISTDLLFDLIEHPLFQRLRRIRQLGLTSYVYPGALHTRFHHSIGAMHLTREAIDTLRLKGFDISPGESEATLAAILLHDLGHGPFSHALEYALVKDSTHEELSLFLMKQLNDTFNGRLDLAIAIFTNTCSKPFLHQLVSGQLDMDRLDYLKRDSFYTGVAEGVISTDRIIRMLTVSNDELVVEAKGIYSIEKFIVARRLMYWQVYYHKTVVAVENMLINLLRRARLLAMRGDELFGTPPLLYFLKNDIFLKDFSTLPEVAHQFAALDDFDVYTAIKVWVHHPDFILSTLSRGIVDRQLFKVKLSSTPFSPDEIESAKRNIKTAFPEAPFDAAEYFVSTGT
ncbi:MAG TPA: phosphohydrolase, partial [Bacteroidales bacterium]|nr:phosphohydrolase [Bacteroidales bacterium]